MPSSRTSCRDFFKTGLNHNSRRFPGNDAGLIKFRFSPMLLSFVTNPQERLRGRLWKYMFNSVTSLSLIFISHEFSVFIFCHAVIVRPVVSSSQWKMAKVFPLYKKGDRTDAQNYRPISVLPVVSKICERVVNDKLYRYLNSNGLLTKTSLDFVPFTLQWQRCYI